ncbi:DUF397 domain-containing protein [Sphaerisporangium sp. NPDC005288]|uniref:DUF397 domain-containing protein n=1 Tax=Sphaerisporangium rhizosphaerae TaxID=2269375 RepID=A0ABW2NV97_9ACTN
MSETERGMRGIRFQTASACEGGTCVEVAQYGEDVYVRDSKHPEGPVLRYTKAEWAAFVIGVKLGEFDVQ